MLKTSHEGEVPWTDSEMFTQVIGDTELMETAQQSDGSHKLTIKSGDTYAGIVGKWPVRVLTPGPQGEVSKTAIFRCKMDTQGYIGVGGNFVYRASSFYVPNFLFMFCPSRGKALIAYLTGTPNSFEYVIPNYSGTYWTNFNADFDVYESDAISNVNYANVINVYEFQMIFSKNDSLGAIRMIFKINGHVYWSTDLYKDADIVFTDGLNPFLGLGNGAQSIYLYGLHMG
jgi:hypothetical protein